MEIEELDLNPAESLISLLFMTVTQVSIGLMDACQRDGKGLETHFNIAQLRKTQLLVPPLNQSLLMLIQQEFCWLHWPTGQSSHSYRC